MELQVSIASCLETGDDFIEEPSAVACASTSRRTASPVHKMLEVQSLYKPTQPHQPSAKRRRLRLTSVPLVDLRVPQCEGSGDSNDFYGSLNSPPRSLSSDVDSISSKSGICSVSESMDTPKSGTSSIRIKHLTSSWESESRFPKLNECAHFHYEFVELGPINVCIFDEAQENSKLLANGALDRGSNFAVQVSSNGKSWVVRRSYENFRMLDQQLHQCIYDRKFSALQEIPKEWLVDDEPVHSKTDISSGFSEYLQRFSDIAGNLINCGPILNWLELDNRGNRLIVTDDSAINTPAVAAAYVTKRYIAQATDEISFEVGDMISVIDMPPPDESIWWRGKRGFEVGFFPSECVEVIGDKIPHSIHIPKAPTKPVLRKHGKLIAFFRSFILSRPSRRKLKQSGILKERVFGCDLGEHLLNSEQEIPMVLKCCSEFIETHGIVDGIYRLSGVTSNIQKLRNTFDEERVPDLNDEAILHDIHCVASLLKMYFRELPNPLLTYQLYDKFVSAVQSDDDVRLLNVRDVVQQLPPPHYRTLEYLVRHLSRVAAHGSETGMTPKNVAIVWAPNLLRSKDLEIGGVAALQVVGVQAVVTEFLIHYSDLIFNDKMPSFVPCPEYTGTPKRSRPKSLAISTPTKLLSLDEARSRALGAIQFNQKYIEVGGGPSMLPNKYHTVIELPDRKRGSSKHKKSPSGWKSFFSKGKSTQQSARERDKSKNRRKGSSTPSDPGISIGLIDKAITEPDVSRNNNRLRSVKSAESLIPSIANSQRNSDAIDCGKINIDSAESEDLLSSSLGAVSSTQLRQSPHSHIRSISHDSYFEFSFERHTRGEKHHGELATITSEDNDEDQERILLDDFIRMHYVDQTSESSATCQTDEPQSSTLNEVSTLGTSTITDNVNDSSTPVYSLIKDGGDNSEDTFKYGTETLQEQSSIDSDDDHSDIVGDIQQEVAAALHWDQPSYSSLHSDSVATSNCDLPDQSLNTFKPIQINQGKSDVLDSKIIIEKYGNEKTVIVEVHATTEVSSEEEADISYLPLNNSLLSDVDSLNSVSSKSLPVESTCEIDGDRCEKIEVSQNVFSANSLALYDSLEAGEANLVNEIKGTIANSENNTEVYFPDSLEVRHITDSFKSKIGKDFANDSLTSCSEVITSTISLPEVASLLVEENDLTESTAIGVLSLNELYSVSNLIEIDNSYSNVDVSKNEHENKQTGNLSSSEEKVSLSVNGVDLLTGDDVESDSSHVTNGEISSTSSPCSTQDPFGYSVLINEEEFAPSTISNKDNLIDLNLDLNAANNILSESGFTEDWVVVDAGSNGIEVKIFRDQPLPPTIEIIQSSSDSVSVEEDIHLKNGPDCDLNFATISTPHILAALISPSISEPEPSSPCQRHSLSLADKMSPVEESKRKFESEIGRDILRERKMKLELEKIQAEQRCEKISPEKCSQTSPKVMETATFETSEFEVDFENVELRQLNIARCEMNNLEDSKRASEPVLSPTKPVVSPVDENKRYSEPSFKISRPERKASVKELMSKFEKKPKIESHNKDNGENRSNDVPISTVEHELIKVNIVNKSPETNFVVEKDVEHLTIDSKLGQISRSQENLETGNQPSGLLQSPSEESNLMTVSLEGGLDKQQVYDQARRERIDKYKEERRAQLRERIRSESFREQDVSTDYILRLKQKSSGKLSSSEKIDDSCGLPISPRRRARYSAVGCSHSSDDYAKPDNYLTRRRSFNARSSVSSNNLVSPTNCNESFSSIVNDRTKWKDKKFTSGSEQPLQDGELITVGSQNFDGSVSKCSIPRPKELSSQKIDFTGISLTPVQKKSSPTDSTSSNRIKSPMKERSNNVPLSPTPDIITSKNDESSAKKESRVRYLDKDNENPPSAALTKSKSGKSIGPAPPPRKIKDVAALFEQPERLQKQDHSKDGSHEEGELRVRSNPRPFSSHVPVKLKVATINSKEGDGTNVTSTLSGTTANHKLKTIKKNSP